MCLDLMESEKPIGVKIAAIRSVVDIEWDVSMRFYLSI